jgi:DNA-binding XRE family transcriptional regulator
MCMSYSSQVFENQTLSEAVSRRTENAKENGQFSLVFNGARVARSLVFCVMICRSLFVFLTIVLYGLRITASGYLPLLSSSFSFFSL